MKRVASSTSVLFILLALLTTPLSASNATDAVDEHAFTTYLLGGRSVQTWHGQATMESIHFEWSRPYRWKSQLAFDFAPYSIRQPRSWFGDKYRDGEENVRAIAFGATLRKVFRPGMDVRPFAEIGTGPMIAEYPVPAATSFFNMATHGGFGVIIMGSRDLALYVGYRFLHVSNGGLTSRNPGLNVHSIVIGSRLTERD